MAYRPQIRSPKGTLPKYKRDPIKKAKKNKDRRFENQVKEEPQVITEKEISELTLKRLHTLGNQRFGAFPFSEYFAQWLSNVSFVLTEFESFTDMNVDDQYVSERSEILSTIKLKLGDRHRIEASVNQEITNLAEYKNDVQKINQIYLERIRAIVSERNNRLRVLNRDIEQLKKDQDEVIRMKTGFFRGISKKAREQKEINVMQKLSDKQNQLELAILDLNTAKQKLQEECARKKEPLLEPIKNLQKSLADLEIDGSLEERWFACQSLIDSVNAFLQRKTMETKPVKTNPTESEC
jgi:hypothetical protein